MNTVKIENCQVLSNVALMMGIDNNIFDTLFNMQMDLDTLKMYLSEQNIDIDEVYLDFIYKTIIDNKILVVFIPSEISTILYFYKQNLLGGYYRLILDQYVFQQRMEKSIKAILELTLQN